MPPTCRPQRRPSLGRRHMRHRGAAGSGPPRSLSHRTGPAQARLSQSSTAKALPTLSQPMTSPAAAVRHTPCTLQRPAPRRLPLPRRHHAARAKQEQEQHQHQHQHQHHHHHQHHRSSPIPILDPSFFYYYYLSPWRAFARPIAGQRAPTRPRSLIPDTSVCPLRRGDLCSESSLSFRIIVGIQRFKKQAARGGEVS